MNKYLNGIIIHILLGINSTHAATTDIASQPIQALIAATPNMIFVLDDSGSMDFEVLVNASDGEIWWNATTGSFTDNNGVLLFNPSASSGPDNNNNIWYEYDYFFPNGTNSDARLFSDGNSYGMFAVPPIPAFAWLRSSQYNPIYYDPMQTYNPWPPAYINNQTVIFTNANPTAARSHPVFPTSGTPTTINLATSNFSTSSNWTFRMVPGMTIPGATISGIQRKKVGSNTWGNITTNYTIPSNESWDVAIPYYPATYYMKDATCTTGYPNCVTAPDGNTLRRYQVSAGTTFPSGRTYAAELQNFANWFTYYRKHKLLLAGAMGQTLSQVTGFQAGIFGLNNQTPVTMNNVSSTNNSQNWQAIAGVVYTNPSSGGTPTRSGLNYAGNQYMTNKNIIQYGCQVNSAMMLTDGYAYNTGPSVPNYTPITWGNGMPYQTIYPGSLADLALAYYTLNLRTDLPTGLVPIDNNNTAPSADKNPNLHMTTSALSLGPLGTIYGINTQSTNNPYQHSPTWPDPNATGNYSPVAIDDLWHATINGRGLMFNASNINQLVPSIQNMIENVLVKSGAGASGSVANVNLSNTNNNIYMGSYSGWYGDVVAYSVNLATGAINTTTPLWSARSLLDTMTSPSNTRKIVTYNGNTGVPFQWTNLPTSMQTALNTPNVSPTDGSTVLNWLRGDGSLEGSVYRSRGHLLGDIVNAQPVLVAQAMANYLDAGYAAFQTSMQNRPMMVYQAANDGMLHAFNAASGVEQWAYVPKLVFNNLNKLSNLSYAHRFYVDGTPTVGDVYINNAWRTLLVGGLRAGGNGYYALDITNPQVASETTLAANVLWEFPNNSTPTTVIANIGLSFGKPLLVKTAAAGWVVLVTSGYNNTSGDGKGHLFVLDPATGNVIKDIPTTSGSTASPSGLAQISAYAQNQLYDATIDYVYGGDLNGNVWRFDLSGTTISAWNVSLLATLVNTSGTPQPITTTPELYITNNVRMVYVGTGQLLGSSDLGTTQVQSMYGLVDNMQTNPTISPLRSNLQKQTVSGSTISSTAVNYTTLRGWYFDFPSNAERVSTDPVIAFGALNFTTNQPASTPCLSASYLYTVSLTSGGMLSTNNFNGQTPWARISNGAILSSTPLILTLPNGTAMAIVHNTDNSMKILTLPFVNTPATVQKTGWKEVFIN